MQKYNVYATYTTTVLIGTYETETKEKAIEEATNNAKCHLNLCWQCSKEVDELGLDDESFVAEEISHE